MTDRPALVSFAPPRLLSNPHVQSVLSSYRPRSWIVRWRSRAMERRSREWVIDCGEGVRLLGYLTPAPEGGAARGTVVLLHGWEGSVRSTYLLSLSRRLWSAGYEIVRLNLRDHGVSHHLNEGIFHSCRLAEVVGAVRAIADRRTGPELFLVGFSLGGNFALRVALQAPAAGISLAHVVAVSPAIDPRHVLEAMEAGPPIYEAHFLKKWRWSLRIKQRLFPGLYDFSDFMKLDSVRELTRRLIERYSDIAGLDAYLNGYSVAGKRLAGLTVPTTIVTAADDPIIPVEDSRSIDRPASLRVEIHDHGGHCGFLRNLSLDSWIDERIESLLSAAARPGARPIGEYVK